MPRWNEAGEVVRVGEVPRRADTALVGDSVRSELSQDNSGVGRSSNPQEPERQCPYCRVHGEVQRTLPAGPPGVLPGIPDCVAFWSASRLLSDAAFDPVIVPCSEQPASPKSNANPRNMLIIRRTSRLKTQTPSGKNILVRALPPAGIRLQRRPQEKAQPDGAGKPDRSSPRMNVADGPCISGAQTSLSCARSATHR
jgi:hypothetical protein